jgi:tetratricopeptide (TPR) repeat protein
MKRRHFFVYGIVCSGILASAWVFGTDSGREWRWQHLSTADLLARTLAYPEDVLAHRILAERLMAEGRFEEAATTCVAWIRLEPGSAMPFITQGRALLQAGKPLDAIHPLKEAIRRAPHNANALAALGETLYSVGERVQAEKYLKQAVNRDPSNATAQARLACVLADNHDFIAASTFAEQAMKVTPNSAEGYFATGYVADKMGNSAEAIRALSQTVEIDPLHGQAWELLAAVRVRVARRSEEISQAEATLTQAERLRPHSSLVPYYRGLLRIQQKRYGAAVEEFRHALERDPHFTDALYNLSLALALNGEKEGSARVRKQFQQLSHYIRERSRLQMRIGRDPQRADLWERLAKLAEANGDAHLAELARTRLEAIDRSPLPSRH